MSKLFLFYISPRAAYGYPMIQFHAHPIEFTHCFCIINRLGASVVPTILTPHCVPMPKASIRGKSRHLSHGDPSGTGLLSLSPCRGFCYTLARNFSHSIVFQNTSLWGLLTTIIHLLSSPSLRAERVERRPGGEFGEIKDLAERPCQGFLLRAVA